MHRHPTPESKFSVFRGREGHLLIHQLDHESLLIPQHEVRRFLEHPASAHVLVINRFASAALLHHLPQGPILCTRLKQDTQPNHFEVAFMRPDLAVIKFHWNDSPCLAHWQFLLEGIKILITPRRVESIDRRTGLGRIERVCPPQTEQNPDYSNRFRYCEYFIRDEAEKVVRRENPAFFCET